MGNKNKKEQSQGEKIEMAPQATSSENNKITGNPNDTITSAANSNPSQPTPQFEQVVNSPEEVDKLLIQKMKELSQTVYNFSLKYSEVSGDFKKIGDAITSYWQIYEQKVAMEAANKKQSTLKK